MYFRPFEHLYQVVSLKEFKQSLSAAPLHFWITAVCRQELGAFDWGDLAPGFQHLGIFAVQSISAKLIYTVNEFCGCWSKGTLKHLLRLRLLNSTYNPFKHVVY